jgi:cytochrome c oxidase cbb3-type subunit I/II
MKIEATQLLLMGVILILGAVSVGKLGYDVVRVARGEDNLALGEKVYRDNCVACHGEKGDGKGIQADRLKTKPRDFTGGIYKFRSTPSGSLPLDNDLARTITRGVRGTAMLAQLQLSKEETEAVVQYLKSFSSRFQNDKALLAIVIPPKPPVTSSLISGGKSEYQEAGCAQCHGVTGKGDGPSAKDLRDDWGKPIPPADLTLKPFKSGPEPEDLYRTISTGLNGTPMPSYADALGPKERWALVSYILSIATREKPRGMMGLVSEEREGMRIDMRAAMAGVMGGKGMMGRGMMNRNMQEMMKDMMGR